MFEDREFRVVHASTAGEDVPQAARLAYGHDHVVAVMQQHNDRSADIAYVCHRGHGGKPLLKRCRQALQRGLRLVGVHLGERSEEHTSELQSRENLVCRLLLEKKKKKIIKDNSKQIKRYYIIIE